MGGVVQAQAERAERGSLNGLHPPPKSSRQPCHKSIQSKCDPDGDKVKGQTENED